MRIGRYDIRGLLGRGGMGAVYKAAMPVTGRMVALKALRPADILLDLMGRETLSAMFLAEAATMASISHTNVASILDVHEGGGTDALPPHFTMEYYCGNLGALMGETDETERASRRLGAAPALHLARQMLEGLDRLHYEGIIHRDIKPFNVMLAQDEGGPGTVKLIDFGLSRLRGERPPRHPGMVVGSPWYAAPEQEADPDSAGVPADLFSVGVTLHRMLTGQLPEPGQGGTDPHLTDPDLLGPDWDGFFARALAKNPLDRFADAQAMLHGLDEMEHTWRAARDAACSGADLLDEPPPRTSGTVRGQPLKCGQRDARTCFDLDELWRPRQAGGGRFIDNGDGTVREAGPDGRTGLAWEKHGSRYPLTWERAHAHAARLNERAYGGRTGWRLPTVAELATLFSQAGQPGHSCQSPVFDPRKARLWSGDTKAFTAAWYADAELGFIWWQDRTCRFFARAVCPE
ncbi:protein kinase domain-containing protein [Pseudodesulfovibrio aespoeensis]|uniref:protein kinase domain-containing protein n=1 Tax=Pseudodesulfovibrio aespoeensis TaxID=182210 RepID=UPI00235323CD|nr:protein kinase [Pseudodesulfovibrio aespoeensis]MCG2733476.1 protein kinase [Pseudodesulfovibrio aespoeensis]